MIRFMIRQMPPTSAATLGLLLGVVSLVGCSKSPSTPEGAAPSTRESARGPAPAPYSAYRAIGVAEYRVGWRSTQAHPIRPKGTTAALAGNHWQLTSDKGYTIQLDRAYLATYTVQGIQCPGTGPAPAQSPTQPPPQPTTQPPPQPPPPARPAAPGVQGRVLPLLQPLFSLFESGTAMAGHGKTLQGSALTRPWVEAMLEGRERAFPPVQFAAYPICEVHYLVARANEESLDRPTDPDMLRQSLYLEGTWQDKTGPAHAFVLKTSAAHAKVADIRAVTQNPAGTPGTGTGDGSPMQLNVTVTRTLDGLFDGVDLSPLLPLTPGTPEWTTAETKLTRQLLKNLIDHTQITASLVSPGAGLVTNPAVAGPPVAGPPPASPPVAGPPPASPPAASAGAANPPAARTTHPGTP